MGMRMHDNRMNIFKAHPNTNAQVKSISTGPGRDSSAHTYVMDKIAFAAERSALHKMGNLRFWVIGHRIFEVLCHTIFNNEENPNKVAVHYLLSAH